MRFTDLQQAWRWRPIANCPGRLKLAVPPSGPSLAALLGPSTEIHSFIVPAAPDEVLVARLQGGGGMISYHRTDGSFVHTLNTPEGFERKLAALGITLAPERQAEPTLAPRPQAADAAAQPVTSEMDIGRLPR